MKRKLAQISGATLGYITNDIEGAVVGYNAAGRAYDYWHTPKNLPKNKSMPPTGRRGSDVSMRSTVSTNSSRRGSNSSRGLVSTPATGGGRVRRVLFRGRKIISGGGSAVTVGASKVKGRVAKRGKKRKVKVSAQLRKKIKAVISTKGPMGIVKEAMYSPIMYCSDDVQNIFQGSPIQIEGTKNWAFTPTHFAQHAGVLWNKEQWGALAGDNRQLALVLGYSPNMQIEVLNSYYIMKLKNNSSRVITLKLWDIQPKGALVGTDAEDVNTWIGNELSRTQYSSFNGAENPLNNNQFVIGFTPTLLTSFRKTFRFQQTIVNIEPGKEYYHKVQGPQNKLLKYNGFFKDSTYYPIQPMCKQTLVCVHTDLAADTLGVKVGRFTDMSDVKPYGLLVETEYYSKIKCPDQVGWIAGTAYPASNTVVNNKSIGYAFHLKRYTFEQSGTVVHIDDNNPIDITSATAS